MRLVNRRVAWSTGSHKYYHVFSRPETGRPQATNWREPAALSSLEAGTASPSLKKGSRPNYFFNGNMGRFNRFELIRSK